MRQMRDREGGQYMMARRALGCVSFVQALGILKHLFGLLIKVGSVKGMGAPQRTEVELGLEAYESRARWRNQED